MESIILDTDIGLDVDDALALGMVLGARGDLQLRGVTVVHDDVRMRANLAAHVLATAGRTDVPVAMGVSEPLAEPLHHDDIQAQARVLPKDAAFVAIISREAPDFLYETCRQSPGQITVVAIGPLTNLAATLTRHPDFPGLIKQLDLMGGSAEKDTAEYNIKTDPEAADIVFRSGIPTRLVPLNVTKRCAMEDDSLARLHHDKRPLPALLDQLISFWGMAYHAPRPVLHDPLAVGLLTTPNLYKLEPMRIEVNLHADGPRGRTLCIPDANSPIRVCTAVDYAGFLQHFDSLILD